MIAYTSFDSFLLFGDSITQFAFDINDRGWAAQLANAYQRRLDIINRGFSGYTSKQALHLLPQLLPLATTPTHSKIQFMTIFLGANDSCLPPSSQHTPLERYEKNLRALIDMVHSPTSPTYSPHTKIILICPPPVNEGPWEKECEQRGMSMNRDWKVTKAYAEVCLSVGREYSERNGQGEECQVDVVDTWGIMMKKVEGEERTLEEFLKDGVHLASAGNDVIFEEIMKILRTKYPAWDPAKMPMHGPWWRHLDVDHPETDLLICANKPPVPASTD
ncbi:hypothetical protein BGZ88_003343 [Linnemannia elongata]|uniref:SGNH hydrolase n=1 Tax=Linnemannia elongata AG-77 TaxID=1314771 RepID=A0A197JM82_9FUNG|nr:hypothetical protein BGZ88_003343 [Linnemannia elongata]OAQ26073.1 SGNH hydrolase [Linnemannia elongata AG-77]